MTQSLKIDVLISKAKWREYQHKNNKIYIIGFFYDFQDKQVLQKLNIFKKNEFIKFLKKLDGNFSIIIQRKELALVIADRINSYPLTYAKANNTLYISDNGQKLVRKLKLNENDVDYKVTSSFAMSGYTTYNNTIYKNLKSLLPGQFILIEKNNFSCAHYYNWEPWKKLKNNNFKADKIFHLNDKVIKKLINSCHGRQIILPLSAGWDSRFVASGLKHFNYKNVVCVTYGRKNSNDMKIAKQVATTLGFKWIPIEYNKNKIREVYNSKKYKLYKSYCDNLNAIHFMGEYLMLSEIKKNKCIKKNAIFVNGQSGDFISGNHIPFKINNNTNSIELILEEYVLKHNKYWKALLVEKKIKTIKNQLKNQIFKILGKKKLTEKDIKNYGLYETLEFYNRQIKYVINGVRNYEFFNFEWRMPLWDYEYMQYWEKAPFNKKFQQNYFKSTIKKTNWGNVWNDININPNKGIIWYMRVIRLILKIPFFFLGKKKWHSFERKYIEYFLDDLYNYSPWSYRKIFFDKREHYSSVSWYIAEYLEEKKIHWDGEKSHQNKE